MEDIQYYTKSWIWFGKCMFITKRLVLSCLSELISYFFFLRSLTLWILTHNFRYSNVKFRIRHIKSEVLNHAIIFWIKNVLSVVWSSSCVQKIFRKSNISYDLIRAQHTSCAYQRVRNVSFLPDFVYKYTYQKLDDPCVRYELPNIILLISVIKFCHVLF